MNEVRPLPVIGWLGAAGNAIALGFTSSHQENKSPAVGVRSTSMLRALVKPERASSEENDPSPRLVAGSLGQEEFLFPAAAWMGSR